MFCSLSIASFLKENKINEFDHSILECVNQHYDSITSIVVLIHTMLSEAAGKWS